MYNFEEKNQRFIFWTSLLALREAQTPPPMKKKKEKKKEKELSFFYTFQKLKKRHDTGFYYIHSEITADPCNLIGSNGAIIHKKHLFPLNCIFLPPNEIEKPLSFANFWKLTHC